MELLLFYEFWTLVIYFNYLFADFKFSVYQLNVKLV